MLLVKATSSDVDTVTSFVKEESVDGGKRLNGGRIVDIDVVEEGLATSSDVCGMNQKSSS